VVRIIRKQCWPARYCCTCTVTVPSCAAVELALCTVSTLTLCRLSVANLNSEVLTHGLASVQEVVTTLESPQIAGVGHTKDTDLKETFFCKKLSCLEQTSRVSHQNYLQGSHTVTNLWRNHLPCQYLLYVWMKKTVANTPTVRRKKYMMLNTWHLLVIEKQYIDF